MKSCHAYRYSRSGNGFSQEKVRTQDEARRNQQGVGDGRHVPSLDQALGAIPHLSALLLIDSSLVPDTFGGKGRSRY